MMGGKKASGNAKANYQRKLQKWCSLVAIDQKSQPDGADSLSVEAEAKFCVLAARSTRILDSRPILRSSLISVSSPLNMLPSARFSCFTKSAKY